MMKKTPIFLPVSCRRGTAILLTALLLTGCGGSSAKPATQASLPAGADSTAESAATVGTRDSTPQALVPQMDASATYGNDLVQINDSYSQDGYIQIDYVGTNEKVKMQPGVVICIFTFSFVPT